MNSSSQLLWYSMSISNCCWWIYFFQLHLSSLWNAKRSRLPLHSAMRQQQLQTSSRNYAPNETENIQTFGKEMSKLEFGRRMNKYSASSWMHFLSVSSFSAFNPAHLGAWIQLGITCLGKTRTSVEVCREKEQELTSWTPTDPASVPLIPTDPGRTAFFGCWRLLLKFPGICIMHINRSYCNSRSSVVQITEFSLLGLPAKSQIAFNNHY